jgi:hypothetical protein
VAFFKRCLWVLLGGIVPCLAAGVQITGLPAGDQVGVGTTWVLRVVADDGKGGPWRWTLWGDHAAELVPHPEDSAVTLVATDFPVASEILVRVEDPGDPSRAAEQPVHIVLDEELWRRLLPGCRGPEYLAEELVPLAGPLDSRGHAAGWACYDVQFVDDPAMGPYYRGYFLRGPEGLSFLDPRLGLRPVVSSAALRALAEAQVGHPLENFTFFAVAVRPSGSLPGNPWHTVLACESGRHLKAASSFLFTLDRHGTPRLVGGRDRRPDGQNASRGPLAEANLPWLNCLSLDRAGRLCMGKTHHPGLVTVSPEGEVASIWPPELGVRSELLYAFGVDPATGLLYLGTSEGAIAQVDPHPTPAHPRGRLGWVQQVFPFRDGRVAKIDASQFLIADGRLFILDSEGNILAHNRLLVMDLATRTVDVLMDGYAHPTRGRLRFGLLTAFAPPDLPRHQCADLGVPTRMSPGPAQSLVIGISERGLVQIRGGLRAHPPDPAPGSASSSSSKP